MEQSEHITHDIQGILSALKYLSIEASRVGLDEISQIIQTALMASDDWVNGKALTEKEANIIYLLKEFYFAPQNVKEQTLQIISNWNDYRKN